MVDLLRSAIQSMKWDEGAHGAWVSIQVGAFGHKDSLLINDETVLVHGGKLSFPEPELLLIEMAPGALRPNETCRIYQDLAYTSAFSHSCPDP